jgi:glyoxylase-like metal-dependent hydrolase (beta-lactamase superfamily II)
VLASLLVLFRQFVDDDLGCASYLVGDERAGIAALVDPGYAIERYLDAGVEIVAVLETHTHADHVSGHGRLALEHDIPVRVHDAAGATFPHEPLRDGEELAIGDVVLRVIHTPGHRPEHCAFLVDGKLLLTGDSLFVGDTARPDLAVDAEEGADGLFHSLRRLVELGDDVVVYPGHVAGSLCGANMSPERSTTIARERTTNRSLVETYEEFLCKVTQQPPRPPNMALIVELNRGPFHGAQPQLRRADVADGAVVLDVREPHEFGAGHRAGAVNVPVHGSSFGTKSAFVLPERPLVIEAGSEGDARLAAERLSAVGIFDVAGWRTPGDDEALDAVTVDEVEQWLAADAVQLLDVREKDERDLGFIPGSTHLPYRNVRQAAENGLCGAQPIVTICENGPRAAIAASVLQSVGVDARPVLGGGVATWRGEKYSFRRCGSS